jgi:hypothetical protein
MICQLAHVTFFQLELLGNASRKDPKKLRGVTHE